MICILFLYVVVTTSCIIICYNDAKEYHYTIKKFLQECLIAILVFPFSLAFILTRLAEYLKIKFPQIKINTDFIYEFLNKKL